MTSLNLPEPGREPGSGGRLALRVAGPAACGPTASTAPPAPRRSRNGGANERSRRDAGARAREGFRPRPALPQHQHPGLRRQVRPQNADPRRDVHAGELRRMVCVRTCYFASSPFVLLNWKLLWNESPADIRRASLRFTRCAPGSLPGTRTTPWVKQLGPPLGRNRQEEGCPETPRTRAPIVHAQLLWFVGCVTNSPSQLLSRAGLTEDRG